MKATYILLAAMATYPLSACSSKTSEEQVSAIAKVPKWVLDPQIEEGLAATDCVRFSGNLSIDKKIAITNSRLALAQQINTRVEGVDRTFSSRTVENEIISSSTTFSSVSKQLTKQKLIGSRLVKSDIVKIAGEDHFCVLTILEPSATKALFYKILQQSKRNINAADKSFLYKEFKAHKAN